MRGFLKFLTIFDWPLVPRTIIQSGIHSDGSGVSSLRVSDRISPYTISAILRPYKISIWSSFYHGKYLIFHLRRSQAQQACDVLYEAGIDIL